MNWKTSFAVAACCACSLTLSAQKMSVEFAGFLFSTFHLFIVFVFLLSKCQDFGFFTNRDTDVLVASGQNKGNFTRFSKGLPEIIRMIF